MKLSLFSMLTLASALAAAQPGAPRQDLAALRGVVEQFLQAQTAGLPGQTATVYLDRDRTGRDGVLAATTPVGAGRNTVRVLMPAGLADGTYWPYVVVDGPDGPVTRYAASPVKRVR